MPESGGDEAVAGKVARASCRVVGTVKYEVLEEEKEDIERERRHANAELGRQGERSFESAMARAMGASVG